jgi:hypothetical protein
VTAASAPELRKRPKGARYSQRQLDDAVAGRRTRTNTRKGSAARQAVDRAAYAKRVERLEKLRFTRAQARGHARSSEPRVSDVVYEFDAVPTTTGMTDLTLTSGPEASRTGLYLSDVDALRDGRTSKREFAHKWRRRVRTAGDHELEADPDKVLALLFLNGPGPIDRYRRVVAGAAR